MSTKNLSRKGVAVGAAVALVLTGFSLPAVAAGQADKTLVDLYPTTGTEYTVISGNGKTFAMTSNESSSIAGAGRNVKWLVEDADEAIEPVLASTDNYTFTVDDWSAVEATDLVTIYETGHTLRNGDVVNLSGLKYHNWEVDLDPDNFEGETNAQQSGEYVVSNVVAGVSFELTASSTTVDVDTASTANVDDNVEAKPNTGTVELRRSVRAANGSYVVDSGVSNANANEYITFVQGNETTTRTISVTAWVDTNGDRVINDSEYTSPTRTVTFKKAGELAITTVLDTPVAGDKNLTGYATTVPVLNGEQTGTTGVVATFTRQGTSDTETDVASWSDTTKRWSFSRSLAPSETVWGTLNEYAISAASNSATNTLSVTTTNAHGLVAGDTFVVQGLTGAGSGVVNNKPFTVLDVSNSGKTLTATVDTLNNNAVSASVTSYLGGDRVVSGAYSMKATFNGSDGATQSNVVAAKTVASITNKVNTADGVASTGAIRAGVKAASAQVTLKDADGAVVAGKQVRINVTAAPVGTHYINGTKITANAQTLTATSNSSGVVALAITSDTGVNGNTLQFNVSADGVTGSNFSFAWATPTYIWVETTESADLTTRTVNKGGSYTLNVGVVDQWGKGLTGDYRFYATSSNRHVSAKPYTMSNGFASITVTDDQVVGAAANITVVVKLQKLVSGTWTDDNAVNPSSANLAADNAFVINVVDQTDVVLLDTDNTTTYGAGTADLSDSVVTAELVTVGNEKLDNAGAVYTNGNGVLVTGRVGNSLSYVGRAGATVTISGSSDILFVNGWKSGRGSLTFVADASGEFAVDAYSQKAAKDTVVTVSSNGVSKTVKITFVALTAEDAKIVAPKSVKAGRTVGLTVQFLDKWGNLATATDKATVTVSGPGWLTNEAEQTSVLDSGVVSTRLVTQAGEFGPAVFTATTDISDGAGGVVVATAATWVGPIANAKAGAKKGNVVVEAYRAKGKTVSVFVGGTRVASFVADNANDSMVVKGIKSGTRNVRVTLSGPGEDFRGAVTVK